MSRTFADASLPSLVVEYTAQPARMAPRRVSSSACPPKSMSDDDRSVDRVRPVTLDALQAAAVAHDALPERPADAMDRLARLCAAHRVA